MIIQCRQCNSNYKIDPQKLPVGKSFIRCSKCSASIPISRKEQDKVTNESPKKIIHCGQCHVKYAIPISHFKSDIIKVHCGKCGHVFRIRKDQPDEKQFEDDWVDTSENTRNEIGLRDINISKDESIEMNNLFDDISDETKEDSSISRITMDEIDHQEENPDYIEEEDVAESTLSSPQTPTEKYLDAVKLNIDETSESMDFGLGTISSTQKYKFFLEPNKRIHTNASSESQDFESSQSWPEIQDEVLPPDLLENTEEDEALIAKDSPTENYSENLNISDQEFSLDARPNKITDKKRNGKLPVLTILLLLVLGGGTWFFLYMSDKIASKDQIELIMPQNQIVIMEPLKGKFIENNGNPKALFVLQGTIKSSFPVEADIHSIMIKGSLYKNQTEAISSGSSFAGINLTLSQLRSFSEKEIKAYQLSRRKSSQQSLKLTGNTLPFQIIFYNVPAKIYKMEAKIFSYRKGADKYEL